MGIISWIIFGLIAGILAKWIMPGKDGGGFILTVVLGIIGAVVGGYISTFFGYGKVDGFNFGSFVVAVIGAIVVLFVYRKIRSYGTAGENRPTACRQCAVSGIHQSRFATAKRSATPAG